MGRSLGTRDRIAAAMKWAIAIFALAMSWACSAIAHITSTGLATLTVDDGRLAYRLPVGASEVDEQGGRPRAGERGGRLLAAAADGDRAAAERVAGFLRDYARFSIAGEACQPGRITMRGSPAGDGKVVLGLG